MYKLRQFLGNLTWSTNNQLIPFLIILIISLAINISSVNCGKLSSPSPATVITTISPPTTFATINSNQQQLQQFNNFSSPSSQRQLNLNQNSTIKLESDICEICYCNKDSLTCQKDNRLKSFPILLNETKRAAIKEIIIENQANLTRLGKKELNYYPSITTLTISNCGLAVIEENAFKSNKKLEKIIMTGNPLACNCSNKWIQLNMMDGGSNLGPYWDQITCIHRNGSNQNLLQASIDDCELPKVTVDPKTININETQSITITCNVTGSPVPRVFWRIDDSFSRISSSFLKSQLESPGTGLTLTNVSDPINLNRPYSLITIANPKEANVLIIENITGPDIGSIKCIGENMVGRVQDESTIQIAGKPRIETFESQAKFHLCLNYRITGVPKLKRLWFFNGKQLKFNDEIKDLEIRSPKNPHLMSGCLEIQTTGTKILGNYTLVAVNSYGEDNRTLSVDATAAGLPKNPKLIQVPKPIPPQERVFNQNRGSDGNVYSVRKIVILIGSLGGALILSSIIILSIIHRKNDRINKNETLEIAIREKIPLNASKMIRNPNYSPTKDSLYSDSGLRLIQRSRINFLRELGEGAFGRVFLGTVESLKPDEDSTLAAIKTLKDSSEPEVRKDFEREAEVLSNLTHTNIVQFYGISIDGEPLMMVIEYMKFGDLNNYLRAKDWSNNLIKISESEMSTFDKLTYSDLLKISVQIAAGLEYLSLQHFVHRDLATRNCLVGDQLLVKIGDFGMSRDLYATDYYKIGRQTMLPIRWMSPESIVYRKFTVQSDIWSFGVVLWEIFTYGKQPFYELSNQEVIKEVVEGKILAQPEDCPNIIYELMSNCWVESPFKRITASEVHSRLREIVKEEALLIDDKSIVDSHIMR
ncbi:BDNF/NT-3 growth factors receptor-like isoform X3 [Panonychus citri]|uniref:BDNF/NT-3 growth factors receptor-like isoform X3 n=1 Tax=Panonychus citri TaxID=50023 RepID=UPI0023072592|nr:BDNF/NT-3 growth factors receptor-like isoform X3 [Panonychus citri]